MFRVTNGVTALDADEMSLLTGLDCSDDPGKTHQSFKEECDINEIVRRFGLLGTLPESVRAPQYGDFTGVSDFQSAMNAVRVAQENFMELPAELRYRFSNDPQRLLEFCADDANYDEAVKLGLVVKPAGIFVPEVSGVPEVPPVSKP